MNTLGVAQELGGEAVLGEAASSEVAFVRAVEGGLPAAALRHFAAASGFTRGELRATVGRVRHGGARFGPCASDRLARLAGVAAAARVTFGGMDDARAWMRAPNAGLQGRAPLAVLGTSAGGDLVRDQLIRIDHGVYA